MDEKKNEIKEVKAENMKKEMNAEVTDFDDLRALNEPVAKKDEKEEKEEEKEPAVKKEEKDEKKESADKKEEKDEKKESADKKEEKDEKKESADKKEEKDEKKEPSDKKEEKDEKKEPSEKKKEKEETAVSKKDEKEESKAISASKKLDDVKASKEKEELAGKKEADVKKKTADDTKKGKKGLWLAAGSIAGLLIIAYIAGFIYFSNHFYQDVTVNGVNVSGMNKVEAKQTLDNFYNNYKLSLALIDGSEQIIDGKDISMVITLTEDVSKCLKKQQVFLWFVNMFRPYEFSIEADTVWDEAALEDIYDSMEILKKNNMKQPSDAYVGVVDGKFAIVKEELGSTIKINEFKNVVQDGLNSVMATINLVDMGCYALPEIYEEDDSLKKELDAKNEYAANEIKLQLDDLTLEPGMEIYEAVLDKKGEAYEVSENKVKKYVADLAKEYDTLDTDRTFTTSWDDKQIKTHGKAFGYVMNQEETAAALLKALNAKKPSTVEAVFDSKGYTLQGENDIGDTYIEVNLSEQHVYAYKNGKKVAEGDCVSGNESAGHGTCIGLYAIQGKQSPAVLRGEKKPVTKTVTKKKKGKKVKVEKTTYEYEYESPVTYWMPFSGGIGLHDAAGWRSQYGGSIYYYSGSHGCVNLPLDLAKTLYENFEIGDPVIVYFWDNENRK